MNLFQKIKGMPSWANQTILSIVFFLLILGGMLLGNVIDGAGLVTFYMFLTFFIGCVVSAIISGCRMLFSWFKKRKK